LEKYIKNYITTKYKIIKPIKFLFPKKPQQKKNLKEQFLAIIGSGLTFQIKEILTVRL
jgi:hypothetical protein